MMKLLRFIGNGDGVVDDPSVLHLDGAGGNDFTLCGITLDGDKETAGEVEVVDAKEVTCLECIAIIKHCRGVRVSSPNAKVSCRSPNDSETESPYSAVGSTDLLCNSDGEQNDRLQKHV